MLKVGMNWGESVSGEFGSQGGFTVLAGLDQHVKDGEVGAGVAIGAGPADVMDAVAVLDAATSRAEEIAVIDNAYLFGVTIPVINDLMGDRNTNQIGNAAYRQCDEQRQASYEVQHVFSPSPKRDKCNYSATKDLEALAMAYHSLGIVGWGHRPLQVFGRIASW
ncbi:MAG: hypothetical protein JSU61_06155 [Fidelibacterota bacterium]|nr:MAG: hypothetical protein JSU61_06155 [Candidatus Neomarinimicrobiota bacterium]